MTDRIYQQMLSEGWQRPKMRRLWNVQIARKRFQNQEMARLRELGKALEGKG